MAELLRSGPISGAAAVAPLASTTVPPIAGDAVHGIGGKLDDNPLTCTVPPIEAIATSSGPVGFRAQLPLPAPMPSAMPLLLIAFGQELRGAWGDASVDRVTLIGKGRHRLDPLDRLT